MKRAVRSFFLVLVATSAALVQARSAYAAQQALPSIQVPPFASLVGRPGATQDERQLGALAADQLARQYGLHQEAGVQARLDRIGGTLTKHAPGADAYRFRILKSDDVNAMTTPDGTVFVSRALMRTFKADDDLAAVLAHEIGHVMLGHTAKLLTEPDEIREVPVRTRRGRVVRKQVHVTSDGKRKWEFEADQVGLELLRIAGYPIEGMERVLVFLADEEARQDGKKPASAVEAAAATHPRSADRLALLRELLRARAVAAPAPDRPAAMEHGQ